MSRQLDQKREDQQLRRDKKLTNAVEWELQGAIAHSGGILHGFSVILYPDDVLITLRAEVAGRRMVSFVAADSLANGLRKCVRDALSDRLRWKADKYAKEDL